MGNSRNTGYLQNVVRVSDTGNITFVSGSTTLLAISSSGAVTTTGVISGSNALSASYAATASFVTLAQTASFVANAQSASNAVSAQTASFANAFTVAGTLTAQTLVVQTITSSVDFVTGSTRFGSTGSNTHVFTGSMSVTGSATFIGDILNNGILYLAGSNTVQTTDQPHLFRIANGGLGISANKEAAGNQPIIFYTSGSSRLTILGDGNIGIGTTSPVNKLDIRISDLSTYSSTSTGSALTLYNTSPTTNGFVGIDFISEPSSGNAGRAAINMIVTGNGTGDLAFSTRNTDMGEKMRITSTGNVSIGTNSPVSTNLVGSVTIRKSYGGDSTNGATTQDYYLNQSALYLFGRNSTLSMISNNSEEGEIIFGNNSTRAYARISTGTGASAVGGDMYFKVGSDVERMRITTAGRIGIGTNNPVVNVDIISGSADSIKLRVRNTNATGSAGIIISPEGSGAGSLGDATLFYDVHTTAWVAGVDKSDSSKYKIANDVYGDFRANNFFTIRTNGNVGIGTTNPLKTFEVNGRMSTQAIVSGGIIAGNIASNMPSSPAYIPIFNLSEAAGFSLTGFVNAASYTCFNISQIYIRKEYTTSTINAGITGLYKNACDFSIVNITYSGVPYVALRFTSNPEIDVVWTGYLLTYAFNSDGSAQVWTSGVTLNSTYASY